MTQDLAFERLEQLICDENRIVTYKILSSELEIHVNEAKQYLLEFFENRSKSEHFEAYFFLAGNHENSEGIKSFKFCVVSNSNLEKMKKDFKSLTSCHIYSVNKGKLEDESALYSADQENESKLDDQYKFSSIKHPIVKIRPPVLNKAKPTVKENIIANNFAKVPLKEEKTLQSKSNGLSSMFQKGKNEKKNSLKKFESVSSEKTNEKETTKVEENNKKISPQEKKASNGNALMSMWQKKEDKTQKVAPKKPSKEKKSPEALSNNLMKMFSKQSEKSVLNNNKPSAQLKVSPQIKIEKESPEKKKQNDKNGSRSVSQKRKLNQKQQNKVKAISDSDSEEDFKPQKKKHKRIVTFDDSESESECEEERDKAQRDLCDSESPLGMSEVPMELDDEDEDPIPPTPPVISSAKAKLVVEDDDDEEPIPPTPPVPSKIKANQISLRATPIQKTKSKSWKTVVKTYEDEDGFLVTKKEKELVSASDESEGEDPMKVKSKTEKPTGKEDINKNNFLNKKQASLTSFFKQK